MISVHVLKRGQHSEKRHHTPATSPPAQKARPTPLPTTKPQSEDWFHSFKFFFFFSRRDERGYNATYLDFGFEQFQHGYVEGI